MKIDTFKQLAQVLKNQQFDQNAFRTSLKTTSTPGRMAGRLEIGNCNGRKITVLVHEDILLKHIPQQSLHEFVISGMKIGNVALEFEEEKNNKIVRKIVARHGLIRPSMVVKPPVAGEEAAAGPQNQSKEPLTGSNSLQVDDATEIEQLTDEELEDLDEYLRFEINEAAEERAGQSEEQHLDMSTAPAVHVFQSKQVIDKTGDDQNKKEIDLLFNKSLQQIQQKLAKQRHEQKTYDDSRARVEEKKRAERQEHEEHHRIKKEEVKRSEKRQETIKGEVAKIEASRDLQPPRKASKLKNQ